MKLERGVGSGHDGSCRPWDNILSPEQGYRGSKENWIQVHTWNEQTLQSVTGKVTCVQTHRRKRQTYMLYEKRQLIRSNQWKAGRRGVGAHFFTINTHVVGGAKRERPPREGGLDRLAFLFLLYCVLLLFCMLGDFYYWRSGIVNFNLLGTGFLYSHTSYWVFCGKHFSHWQNICSFKVFLLRLIKQN